ncbi:MAG: PHB depolymerase family esterase [Bacteroidota bacterium]
MRSFYPYLFLFFTLASVGIHPIFGQEKIKEKVEIDGLTRKYRLYIPSSYDANEPVPLVFNLHGLTSDGGQQQRYSRMNEVAEKNGFIVCYPNGKNRAWNVNFPFPSSKADDVAFIDQLVDHLASSYTIDLNRVYSCGFSNGGYMSYRLACELSDRIVAVASVAGTFVPKEIGNCSPSRAVPTLHIHGTADPVVPYWGGLVALSAEETIDFWLDKNDCASDVLKTKLPNISKLDLSRATRYDFKDCSDETSVVLYRVKNGAHTWPGAKIITGITNKDFDASTEIWNFFQQYSFEEPSGLRSRTQIPQSLESLRVVPNPNNGLMNLQISLSESLPVSRAVFNLQGQQLRPTETQMFSKGSSEWVYNLTDLPEGIYFLKVKYGTSILTKKIIIRP